MVDGLLCYENGRLKNLSSLVEGATVCTILTDHDGNVRVGCERGLFKFNGEQVIAHYTVKDGLPDDVTVIHEDRNGDLCILINVTNIKAHGSGPKVQPLPVATGAVGEATEGKLVRIRGTITQPIFNDLPFGFIIFINDGTGEVHSFVCASTGIDVSGLSQGQTIEVTGFSGQFADAYEVDLRFQDDIKVIQ